MLNLPRKNTCEFELFVTEMICLFLTKSIYIVAIYDKKKSLKHKILSELTVLLTVKLLKVLEC